MASAGDAGDAGRRDPRATAWLAGFVLACAVLAFVCWPLSDQDAGGRLWQDGDLWAALVGVAFLQAAVGTALATNGRACWLLSAVAIPLALMGWWGLELRPAHEVQRVAFETFDRYTHRFPADELGRRYVHARGGSRVIVCAPERSRRRGLRFCVGMNTAKARRHRVAGTFRFIEHSSGNGRRFDRSGIYRPSAEAGGSILGVGEDLFGIDAR